MASVRTSLLTQSAVGGGGLKGASSSVPAACKNFRRALELGKRGWKPELPNCFRGASTTSSRSSRNKVLANSSTSHLRPGSSRNFMLVVDPSVISLRQDSAPIVQFRHYQQQQQLSQSVKLVVAVIRPPLETSPDVKPSLNPFSPDILDPNLPTPPDFPPDESPSEFPTPSTNPEPEVVPSVPLEVPVTEPVPEFSPTTIPTPEIPTKPLEFPSVPSESPVPSIPPEVPLCPREKSVCLRHPQSYQALVVLLSLEWPWETFLLRRWKGQGFLEDHQSVHPTLLPLYHQALHSPFLHLICLQFPLLALPLPFLPLTLLPSLLVCLALFLLPPHPLGPLLPSLERRCPLFHPPALRFRILLLSSQPRSFHCCSSMGFANQRRENGFLQSCLCPFERITRHFAQLLNYGGSLLV